MSSLEPGRRIQCVLSVSLLKWFYSLSGLERLNYNTTRILTEENDAYDVKKPSKRKGVGVQHSTMQDFSYLPAPILERKHIYSHTFTHNY